MILLTGCGLLGGCMATVSPRGDVAVSYAVPMVEEQIVTPSYVAYAGSSVTYVSPLSVLFYRSHHRPRPVVAPRPHVVAPAPAPHHVQPGGHHPGGGHHIGGNGHTPGGNGHHPGGNNPGGNGHNPGGGGHQPQPGVGSTHIGGHGPSAPGPSLQKAPAAHGGSHSVKMKR